MVKNRVLYISKHLEGFEYPHHKGKTNVCDDEYASYPEKIITQCIHT
jgi:hypothetical protein